MCARIRLNNSDCEISSAPGQTLLRELREELGLTGTKYGCGEGSCGACTVLLDGEPARACQLLVGDVEGRSLTTIEGLARDGRLHPVQRAFADLGAMQCGYCTPGMVLATAALLARNADPDETDVRSALADNICRCGAYTRILRAVASAAELARSAHGSDRADAPAPLPRPRPRLGGGETSTAWDLLPPGERDYFAFLPDGLVIVLPPHDPDSTLASGGAWIHVGAEGAVTAFTGKVDVGQDSRTALALLVAEELGVPFEAVSVVMGDTDVCPFDPGTFGSRSMPGAGEDLRAAAAAARRSLESHPIEAGVRRVEIVSEPPPATPPAEWRTAGRPTIRPWAVDMVSGATRYPSDLSLPEMLHARVLRAPKLGAALRRADLTAAAAMPGVVAVRHQDFIGVAAPDVGAAERAIRAVAAEWDVELQPGERSLVEDLRSNPLQVEEGRGGPFHHEAGDVDAALEVAPVTLSETYTTAYIAHAPLETRSVLAEWSGGRLTVWTGTQTPFRVRAQL